MRNLYRQQLEKKYNPIICVNGELNRQLVSFQANKKIPKYRWFKYKEGFSAQLVNYLISQNPNNRQNKLLDPFAGTGAALFIAKERGLTPIGIELLPVGTFVIKSRQNAEKVDIVKFRQVIREMKEIDFLDYELKGAKKFSHINITRGAFPLETERRINGFLNYCHNVVQDMGIREALLFALFSILEPISYTRKDGQYLRWDARANRGGKKSQFNKGKIFSFNEALENKLNELISDNFITLDAADQEGRKLVVYEDSVLFRLPDIESDSIDIVITSPPYCNRYDYTRTYALEMAFLGINDEKIKDYRQSLLSCTVENREKFDQLMAFYASRNRDDAFNAIYKTYKSHKALNEIIDILDDYRKRGKLNNPGIVRMVKNYFFEMCQVIFELFRVLKAEGRVYMVNDNVRYAGETIPVDLILSDFAESAGFTVRHIWTLNNGKGNSSQQMGNHGRVELRKCIYVWEKKNS
jgi:DNA modification methylase